MGDAKPSPSLKILSTEKAAGYYIPGHPEHPARVIETLRRLKQNLPAHFFEEPSPAPREALERVHAPDLIQKVAREEALDPDTPGASGIWETSRLSAGAALQAARDCGEGSLVFSLMRPPGHHALPGKGMGFCYLNSMAVALGDWAAAHPGQKAAVLDLDCHHGNGTEAYCHGRENLLFLSLHQSPAYPGTGQKSFGNCLNYPLAPGTAEGDYFKTLETALGRVRDFKPDLLAVSMGFDTYEKDPLTQFGLQAADYGTMGKLLRQTRLPQFALLEGGYHSDLPRLVETFLEGWAT